MTEKDKETVYANRFIGAGGVAYSEQSMAEDSIKRAQQKLLQEANIPTQNSLRDYPSKNAKDEIEALVSFHRTLNDQQKKRHLEFLQKALSAETNDAWRKSDNTNAKRNRDSLRPGGGIHSGDHAMPKKGTVADELAKREAVKNAIKETFGIDDDDVQRFADLFKSAVSSKRLSQALREIVREDKTLSLAFATDEQIDLVDALATTIETLEENISLLENEQEYLLSLGGAEGLTEDVIYADARRQQHSSSSSRRRSLSEEDLLGVDESNAGLFESEQHHGVMKKYTDAIHRSLRK